MLLNPQALGALSREPRCARCARPASTCVCDRLPARMLTSPVEVVILQHPQEDDVVLGTAPLVAASLDRARVVVGLSWPSLEAAVGREGVERARWGVLFASKLPEGTSPPKPGTVTVHDRHGRPRDDGAAPLDGLVVLDGTWSQAKTLWWRNPWLLKLARVSLVPREPSMYGKLRKEPRREWVSTLEAIADVLPALDPARASELEQTRSELRRVMRTMLQRVRDRLGSLSPSKPPEKARLPRRE
ncbi:MAG: tRNA-uridine aminocarboxypropyltransferase [Sandaracinaceae bacterium]